MSPLTLTLCVAVVVWALAAIDGGNDGILEMPKLQEATAGQPAHEGSRLRAWNVREGLDETVALVAPEAVEPVRMATPVLAVDGLEDAREQMPVMVSGASV